MRLLPKMDSLIISSLNCQVLGNLRKRRDFFHYLKQKGHSIYCLQDTHFDKGQRNIQLRYGGTSVFLHPAVQIQEAQLFCLIITLSSRGSTERQKWEFYNIIFHYGQRPTACQCVWSKQRQPTFYQNLSDNIKGYINHNVLAVGDRNLVLDPQLDCYNYKHINNPK